MKDINENKTIAYYNENAEAFYDRTVNAVLENIYDAFTAYLPAGARIIDLGCGSGRDTANFRKMGYDAIGLDASTELAALAKERQGIEVIHADMSSWVAEEPYDGIWCCASLLHLKDDELERFFENLPKNLVEGGVIYISVKTKIETRIKEDGGFVRNFTEDELCGYLENADFTVRETWVTDDTLGRGGFNWIDVIATNGK